MAQPNRFSRSASLRNDDPSLYPEIVSLASTDYTPSGGALFRALNASVAGKITVQRPPNADGSAGTQVQVYVNTGWNAQGGAKVIRGASGDTATIIAAEVDQL